MNRVDFSDAKSQLSALLDRVAAGEVIDIIRHGQLVARLTRPPLSPRKRVDRALLRAVTAAMPLQTQDAAALVRSMRDGDRT